MGFNVNDLRKSKYLQRSDFPKPTLCTISSFEEANVAPDNKKPDIKWVVYFHELEKPLVLNSTNGQMIALISGSEDSEDWLGHKVVLYDDPTISYQGKITGGIRIRAPKTAPVQAKPAPGALTDEKAARLAKLRDTMSKPPEKTLDELNAEAELAAASQEFLDEEEV